MDTWWWLALGAVVLLALVAAYVDGTGRLARSSARPRQGPRPGELWRAVPPSPDPADEPPGGSPDPPPDDPPDVRWLVLATGAQTVRAARVTGGPGGGPAAEPPNLLSGSVRELPYACFRRRVGTVDADLWARVRHLAD